MNILEKIFSDDVLCIFTDNTDINNIIMSFNQKNMQKNKFIFMQKINFMHSFMHNEIFRGAVSKRWGKREEVGADSISARI